MCVAFVFDRYCKGASVYEGISTVSSEGGDNVSPNDPMAFAAAAVILPAVAILMVLVLTALRQS